jgi:hypothetical protein
MSCSASATVNNAHYACSSVVHLPQTFIERNYSAQERSEKCTSVISVDPELCGKKRIKSGL